MDLLTLGISLRLPKFISSLRRRRKPRGRSRPSLEARGRKKFVPVLRVGLRFCSSITSEGDPSRLRWVRRSSRWPGVAAGACDPASRRQSAADVRSPGVSIWRAPINRGYSCLIRWLRFLISEMVKIRRGKTPTRRRNRCGGRKIGDL